MNGKDDVKVLVCVSGMPYAEPTLSFGNLMATLLASKVTLLTVVQREREEIVASVMLQRAQEFFAAPIEAIKVRQGESVQEIVREGCAADDCYDMILVGSRDAHGLVQFFVRTVTQKVAERAPISVLVVKEERPCLKQILVCVGGKQMNPAVIEWGAKLAKASEAKLQVLYVSSPVPGMYLGLDEMDESLPELLRSNTPIARHLRWGARFLADYGVTAEIKVRYGIAVDEILLETQEKQYDLLVIGARAEMTLLNELLMDKVTPHIVDHAPCSVLVVRGKF